MLYVDGKPLISIGKGNVITKVPNHDPKYIGSVYVKNTCMVRVLTGTTSNYRVPAMNRFYDLLCWKGGNASSATNKPSAGGFEIEMTFESTKSDDNWQTIIGARGGSVSAIQRINMLISSAGQIQHGVSQIPSSNTGYGDVSLIGRKVTARQIIIPTTSETYKHAYSSRIIVTDCETNETLVDETDVFGENAGKDLMVTNGGTFYRFPWALFYRASTYTPSSQTSGANGFEGYFWGGKIYANPTGIDSTFPTRVPIHVFTPAQKGVPFDGTRTFDWGSTTPYTPQKDCVMAETVDVVSWSSGIYNKLSGRGNLAIPAAFSSGTVQYID